MDQHPKITLDWALRSLERALQQLGDGHAERRVRRQFHQVLLAVERDSRTDQPLVYYEDGGAASRSQPTVSAAWSKSSRGA